MAASDFTETLTSITLTLPDSLYGNLTSLASSTQTDLKQNRVSGAGDSVLAQTLFRKWAS